MVGAGSLFHSARLMKAKAEVFDDRRPCSEDKDILQLRARRRQKEVVLHCQSEKASEDILLI